MSYLFTFSYYSWGSQGKTTEVVCHSLLQWTTFCQTSPPWPARLEWPHMAWLSFIKLDKAVVHVIRLASFLWLWFQSVCPLMPSHNTYRLTWVSLTLDVGYVFTAAPAKHSHCSLPQTWGNREEIPYIQGKRNPSKTVGAEKGHQRADKLKPQSQTTGQSDHTDHSFV